MLCNTPQYLGALISFFSHLGAHFSSHRHLVDATGVDKANWIFRLASSPASRMWRAQYNFTNWTKFNKILQKSTKLPTLSVWTVRTVRARKANKPLHVQTKRIFLGLLDDLPPNHHSKCTTVWTRKRWVAFGGEFKFWANKNWFTAEIGRYRMANSAFNCSISGIGRTEIKIETPNAFD